MKTNAALFLAFILAEHAFATEEQIHGGHETSAMHASIDQSQNSFFNAEILRVDKGNNKVTIRHEEIKNLAMPPMMMTYQVKSPGMLNQFKEVDLVRIRAIMQNGRVVIIRMILQGN